MTANELDHLIGGGDTEACAAFFDAMPESKRKPLAARAQQWAKASNGYANRNRDHYLMLIDKTAAQDVSFFECIKHDPALSSINEAMYPCVRVAMLATNPLPELKKTIKFSLPEAQMCTRIMRERKPGWLAKWCAFLLKEALTTHWSTVRALEEAGLCSIEHDTNYWLSMLCTLSSTDGMYETHLSVDAKLRDDMWLMLADPGVMRMLLEPEQISHEIFRKRWNSGGNIFAPKQVGDRTGSEKWLSCLVQLSQNNLIDRERLTDYSFMLLASASEKEAKKSVYQYVSTADFAIKLNQAVLKDKESHYAARIAAFLGATHKDVSTYASSTLSRVPAGTITASDICANITPAFLNKSKEPAEAAIKLLDRLVKQCSNERIDLGIALLSAFEHSSKDIHKKALNLIESAKLLEAPEVLADFLQRLDMLSGMERTKASQLAEKYDKPGAPVSAPVAQGEKHSAEDLYDRAAKLDKNLSRLARIDESIAASKRHQQLEEAVQLDSLDFPRLGESNRIAAINSFDDLVFATTQLLSGKASALDMELILDGYSRLCAERPPNFEEKTESIGQKVLKLSGEMMPFGGLIPIMQLAEAWLNGNVRQPNWSFAPGCGVFFGRRCHDLSKRVAKRQAAPLLAAPTHKGGWVEAKALVTRLEKYFWLKMEPDKSDVIQALLRLAPDDRESALQAASSLRGEIGEVVQYALGGALRRIGTPELYVAAYRAREPKGTSDELKKLLRDFGPDGAEPAEYALDISDVIAFGNDRYSLISHFLPEFLPVKSADPNFPCARTSRNEFRNALQTTVDQAARIAQRNRYQYFPTVLLHDNATSWFAGSDTYTWLHNRESLLALYAKRMLQNIDSIGSYWHGDFEFIFDPDISMAGNGRYFILMTMSSKNNDLSRLAVDALIAAISECRITARGLGEAMAAIIPSRVITVVRWTRGLRDAGRVSKQHAQFVWNALSSLLVHAELAATQQIPFLELLVELQVAHGYAISDELRNRLNGASSGKGGKMAKTLQSFVSKSSAEEQASLQDLLSRIIRVERWQQCLKQSRAQVTI